MQDFNYSVNPLVFDLELRVDPGSLATAAGARGWRILQASGPQRARAVALAQTDRAYARVTALFMRFDDSCRPPCTQVYGSPNPNDTARAALGGNGTISRVSTLFPSPKSEEGIKGGVVLLRVQAPSGGVGAAPLALQATYTDREGKRYESARRVDLPPEALQQGGGGTYAQSTGVRKAVLLARYTDLLRNW